MSDTSGGEAYKSKAALKTGKGSVFAAYRTLYYGQTSLWHLVKSELIVTATCGLSGALGLLLRKVLYPWLFKAVGRGVVFGRNLTLRHAHKITLGRNVILDDNVVIDAKGDGNGGIVIEDDVYIGRNTILYCKGGSIRIGRGANLSSNCQVFSSNQVTIGPGTVIAAFTYILSGGQYDYRDRTVPFAQQSGMITRGPTVIGANCWLGAGVVVVDGVRIGEHCVIGAGAVVTSEISADSLAVGTPAKVSRFI